MEKGAAKRFLGKPRENLRSLLIKPRFDLEIVYFFRRSDFHPQPSVDVVLLHMSKKSQPDMPPARWGSYQRFITHGLQKHGAGLYALFTKRQLNRAFREINIDSPGEIRYVQWLCLFRWYLKYVLAPRPF
jgi:23S rRNA (adenine-N6)-dimethyltransferase